MAVQLTSLIGAMEAAAPTMPRGGSPGRRARRKALYTSLGDMREALDRYNQEYPEWATEHGRGTDPDWWSALSITEQAQARRVFDLAKVLRRRIAAAEKANDGD